MKSNIFKKQYIAILEGTLEKSKDIINASIARKPDSIIERCVDSSGSLAITHYDVLEKLKDATLVCFQLETGRTHQLRVHSQFIGHPILGDTLYGNCSELINRQALHAYKVTFIHPITKKTKIIKADIPEDMISVIQQKR